MMCICGNVLKPNAKECPACGGTFEYNANPQPAPVRAIASGFAPEVKRTFDPVIAVSVAVFVLTVIVGVLLQSIA